MIGIEFVLISHAKMPEAQCQELSRVFVWRYQCEPAIGEMSCRSHPAPPGSRPAVPPRTGRRPHQHQGLVRRSTIACDGDETEMRENFGIKPTLLTQTHPNLQPNPSPYGLAPFPQTNLVPNPKHHQPNHPLIPSSTASQLRILSSGGFRFLGSRLTAFPLPPLPFPPLDTYLRATYHNSQPTDTKLPTYLT
jgi:hypothetical protein